MARIIGRTGSVGIGVESTRGTSVAPTHFVPVQGYSLDDKVEYIKNDSGLGHIAENNESDILHLWAEGDVEGKVFVDSIGVELTALFGASPSSAERTTTDVFDHTYALANNNQHKSLTLAYKDANEDVRFALGMINTYAIEAAVDNYLKRTVSFITKKSASASNTVAHTEDFEFIPNDITVKFATDLAGLGAASEVPVRSVNIEFNKNAEAQYILGSQEPDDIVNKQFAVTGSFEAYMDNTTYKVWANTGVRKAFRFEAINPTVIGSSGSHTPALRFDFAKVKFESHERNFDNNEVMLQTINFEAYYDLTEAEIVEARLTNENDGTDY